MSATAEQTGRAIQEIAEASSGVAEGAERQIRLVGETRAITGEAVELSAQGRRGRPRGRRADHRDRGDRRADQPVGLERGDRGGARRRAGPRLRGRGRGGPQARGVLGQTVAETRTAFEGLATSIAEVSDCVGRIAARDRGGHRGGASRRATRPARSSAAAEQSSASTQQVAASAARSWRAAPASWSRWSGASSSEACRSPCGGYGPPHGDDRHLPVLRGAGPAAARGHRGQGRGAGFPDLWISDPFHPWVDAQGESPLCGRYRRDRGGHAARAGSRPR